MARISPIATSPDTKPHAVGVIPRSVRGRTCTYQTVRGALVLSPAPPRMCGRWFMLGHRWCPGWRSWLLGLLSPAGHKKGAAVTAAPVGRTLKEAGELHRLGSLCAAVDFRPRRPRGQARAFRSRGACRGIPGSSPSISVMISPARQSRCHSRAFFLVVWGIGLSPSGLTVLCVLTTKGHQQPVGGELLLSPQSVEIIKFGDPGSGR